MRRSSIIKFYQHLVLFYCSLSVVSLYELADKDTLKVHGQDGCPPGERKYGKIDPNCEPSCYQMEFKCQDPYHEEVCLCDLEKGYVRDETSGCVHITACPGVPPFGGMIVEIPPCGGRNNSKYTMLSYRCAPTCDRPGGSCSEYTMDDGDCLCDMGRGFVLNEATRECVFHEDCPKKPKPRSNRRNSAPLSRRHDV